MLNAGCKEKDVEHISKHLKSFKVCTLIVPSQGQLGLGPILPAGRHPAARALQRRLHNHCNCTPGNRLARACTCAHVDATNGLDAA